METSPSVVWRSIFAGRVAYILAVYRQRIVVVAVPCSLHCPQTGFKHGLEQVLDNLEDSYYDVNIVTRALRRGFHSLIEKRQLQLQRMQGVRDEYDKHEVL